MMQSKLKILVVDDTPANLEILMETLTSAGYQVATALDGERALKRLQTYLPDLILLDVQMPGIDGFETCRQIKADPSLAHIPIIFITALCDAESVVQGFSLGAVDYIGKPFCEAELLIRLQTHLHLQQLKQHLEQQVAERTSTLESTLADVRSYQLQLIQQEKMSALGNLVAGVAHEVNNPIGCVQGNVKELKQNLNDVFKHLRLYQQQAAIAELEAHAEEIELDFLLEDMPKMLQSMEISCDRIRSISTSLRTFSRADQDNKVSFDLHEGLESTLLILKHRLKANDKRPDIELIKHYATLPPIKCFPGQINQVFMNILANAIDMFDEIVQQSTFADLQAHPQIITIQTVVAASNTVEIRIRDNGKGMSEDVQARIFDHLFTTKGVGKGTGLGLAIVRQIVEENHGGSLSVQSKVGQGTEFCLRLAIKD